VGAGCGVGCVAGLRGWGESGAVGAGVGGGRVMCVSCVCVSE